MFLVNADLRGHDFSGQNLSFYNFRFADLRDANFSGANLQGANLQNADIRGAIFHNAFMDGVLSDGVVTAKSRNGIQKRYCVDVVVTRTETVWVQAVDEDHAEELALAKVDTDWGEDAEVDYCRCVDGGSS